MRHYRQHPIVLLSVIVESLLLSAVGLALTILFAQPLLLMLVPVAIFRGVWRCVQWATFSIRIEGRQITLRNLRGFVVNERILSLNSPGGLRLRQNVSGYFLDYGLLRIELFSGPVQIAYIAPFSSLRQQIEGRP